MTWRYAINIIWWCVPSHWLYLSQPADNRSILEMYTGIFCACLPCLKAFSRHAFPSLFQRFSSGQPPRTLRLNTVSETIKSLPGVRRVMDWRSNEPTALDDDKGAHDSAWPTPDVSMQGSTRSETDKKKKKQRGRVEAAAPADPADVV